jgi:hypothetical protein
LVSKICKINEENYIKINSVFKRPMFINFRCRVKRTGPKSPTLPYTSPHFVCKVFMWSREKLQKCSCFAKIIKQRLLSIILCSTLIIFLSVIWYGQVLSKKAAMYGVKKWSFCSGTDQRNKIYLFIIKTKVCKTTTRCLIIIVS